MSKSNRQRRAAKRRRTRRDPSSMRHQSAEPDLFAHVRTALDDPDPLHLLGYVSTMLAAVDPRGRDHPFARADAAPDTPTREVLAATFVDVAAPETTALLSVIAELADDDDILRARIRRELATRPDTGPGWLRKLGQTSAYRAVRMGHVLGDGENIMIGVRLAGSYELTFIVYIDHNFGRLVKDAFVVAEPIVDMITEFRCTADETDSIWEELSLADARAWLEDAIETAAVTFPPLETASWPACRPLIEWVTRGLPEGGCGYQRPQWDPSDLSQLANRFFDSQWGRPLDDADHRDLLDSLLWYGTNYGPGDPLRWSVVRVEILFEDWLPRKIIAPVEYLARAPQLLRAFVCFAHNESGLRVELTDETLAAIERSAPGYQEVIRSPRPQGPEALLDALGIGAGELGLPGFDEPFDWSGIADDVAARVAEVLTLTDRCCDELLDVEYRTVARRVLARVAAWDAAVFRRKARVETAAAAVVWIAGRANGLFDTRPGRLRLRAADVANHFGVKGSPSQRASVMLRAGGFRDDTYDVELGSPHYLIADRREWIIGRRDNLRQQIALSE